MNCKPLGLQTVLDDLTKDGMVILGLTIIYEWLTWIKFDYDYNCDVAIIVTKINAFFRVSLMAQAFTFSVTRYLFAFKFHYINNISEGNIKMTSRICVLMLASTCAIVDNWYSGKKFLYLTGNHQINNEETKDSRPFLTIIVVISSLMIVAFVQAQIAYTRFKHPELQNNVGADDTYNLKMISGAVVLSIVMLIVILASLYARIVLWKSLLIVLCVRMIVLFMILLVIYSNEKMSLFVKNSLMPFQVNPDPEISQVDSAPNEEIPVQEPIQHSFSSQIQIENPTPNERVCKSSFEFSLQVLNEFSHRSMSLPDIYV